MAQERITPSVAEKRCPNCGTRVARNAESCFMCGYDLRNQTQGRRRFSWIDALLVAAVLGVLIFWWRVGTESDQADETDVVQAFLPTSVPLMEATPTPIPTATPLPTATPVPLVQEAVLIRHVVQSGETLLSIAIDYDVSVEEIQRANNLSSELIRVDDELVIPVLRDSAAGQSIAAATKFEYMVQSGDTLSTIATKFGSTVEDLLVSNNLAAGEFIQPGDMLVIPVLGAPPEALAVEPGAGATQDRSTSNVVYVAPRLDAPQDGATLPRADAVKLQWSSAGALAPNEWYIVQILPRNLAARTLPIAWTKETNYRLDPSLAPEEGQVADYAWLVSIVRVSRAEDGRALIESASPLSTVRTFSWQ